MLLLFAVSSLNVMYRTMDGRGITDWPNPVRLDPA